MASEVSATTANALCDRRQDMVFGRSLACNEPQQTVHWSDLRSDASRGERYYHGHSLHPVAHWWQWLGLAPTSMEHVNFVGALISMSIESNVLHARKCFAYHVCLLMKKTWAILPQHTRSYILSLQRNGLQYCCHTNMVKQRWNRCKHS